MHNFRTVVTFEVMRTLKKKTFWLSALSVPLMSFVIFAIAYFAGQTTNDAIEKQKDEKISIAITDESHVIMPQVLQAMHAQKIVKKEDGVEKVKTGAADVYYYIPADLSKQELEIYAKHSGVFENGKYHAIIAQLLQSSAAAQTPPAQAAILQKQVKEQMTIYQDGEEYNPIANLIAPGFFLVIFYFVLVTFANQMLSATIEEKENRTVEMLFTTIKPRTLLTGKIASMAILVLVQMCIILVPIVIALFSGAGEVLSIPSIDLSTIVFDPVRISLAIAIFIVGLLMIMGLLLAIGSIMPTAKEANSWMGVIFLAMFGPLYGAAVLITQPDSLFSQSMTYFPLTAPVPLLLRNAVGNLTIAEALISLSILVVTSVIVMALAVRLFRYGAMQYDSKLSLSALRARRKNGTI